MKITALPARHSGVGQNPVQYPRNTSPGFRPTPEWRVWMASWPVSSSQRYLFNYSAFLRELDW